MSDDLIGIIGCIFLGLMAHGASRQPWLEWVLRVIYGLGLLIEVNALLVEPAIGIETPWTHAVMFGTTVATGLLLFSPGRKLFSLLFTFINQIIAGRVFLALLGKLQIPVAPLPKMKFVASAAAVDTTDAATESEPSARPHADAGADTGSNTGTGGFMKASIWRSFLSERIFVPESIPHMNGLWIYVTCLALLLTHIEPGGLKMPAIMVPIPITFDQLFNYNFLGLIVLAFCGAGIFVKRKPAEVLRRLGLVKPTGAQVLLGVAGIFLTFIYDYLWSTYTHSQAGIGYAGKLTNFNEGTFTPGGAPMPALFVASATGLCAGLGEETLMRGALQPVFGIIPAALMHGVLHGQFSHAPLFIVQVFGWSVLIGILRRYTNTTTTIITHVGFNFLSTFLIAFNP